MGNDLLNDIKHCRLDLAEKIVKEYDKPINKFLDQNRAIYEDYLEHENDYSLAEFLWHGYWNEVCEYLQKSA